MIFNNEEFALTIQIDGNKELMFDAEQVAKNLGFVDASKGDKVYVKWDRLSSHLSTQVSNGDLISESQVYKLAFKAKNELAERFTDWLANEVLPEIRKTGGYSLKPVLPADYPSALRALAEEVEKKEQLLIENKQQADKIEKDKPLVEMAKALMDLGDEEGKIRPTDFAKAVEGIYGIGRNNFYALMRDMHIWNKDNIPYARFVQGGYFLVRENKWHNKDIGMEGVSLRVWITPKGRQYLVGKLNNLFDTEEV